MSYFIFDIPNEIERLKSYGTVDENLITPFLTEANDIIADVSEGINFYIYNSFKSLITQMIHSSFNNLSDEKKITFFENKKEYIELELRNFNPQNYRNKFFDNGFFVFESKKYFAKYLSDKIQELRNYKPKTIELKFQNSDKNKICYAIIELSKKFNLIERELLELIENNSNAGRLIDSFKVEQGYTNDKTNPLSIKNKIKNNEKIKNRYYIIKEMIETYLIDNNIVK